MLRLGVTDDPLMMLFTSTKLSVYVRMTWLRVLFGLLYFYQVSWILVSVFFILCWEKSPLFMQLQCLCIIGTKVMSTSMILSLIMGCDVLAKFPEIVKEHAWNLKSCGEKTFAMIKRSSRVIEIFHISAYFIIIISILPRKNEQDVHAGKSWQPVTFLMDTYLTDWKLWLNIVYIISSLSCVYAFFVLLNTCNYTLCHIRFQYHILNCYVSRLAKLSMRNCDKDDYQEEIYESIVTVVRIHQQVKKVCNKLLTHADHGTIGLTLAIIALFFCIAAFIVFEVHPATNLTMIVSMIPVALFVGYICSNGQRAKNESEKVYNNALKCAWYNWSMKNRRAYLIFLANNMTPMKFTKSGVIDINHELFMYIGRTIYTLFTLLINLSGKPIKF